MCAGAGRRYHNAGRRYPDSPACLGPCRTRQVAHLVRLSASTPTLLRQDNRHVREPPRARTICLLPRRRRPSGTDSPSGGAHWQLVVSNAEWRLTVVPDQRINERDEIVGAGETELGRRTQEHGIVWIICCRLPVSVSVSVRSIRYDSGNPEVCSTIGVIAQWIPSKSKVYGAVTRAQSGVLRAHRIHRQRN